MFEKLFAFEYPGGFEMIRQCLQFDALYGHADNVDVSPKEEEGSDQGESPSVKAEEVEEPGEKPPVIVPAVFCRPFEPVSFHS